MSLNPFPHLSLLGLRRIAGATTPTGFHLHAHATRPSAICPACQRRSRSIHSHYERTLREVPWGDRPLTVHLRLRRFRCRTRRCQQHIFCERVPDLAAVGQRRTTAFSTALQRIGFALGGAAGARLAHHLRLPTSPATLLRVVKSTVLPPPAPPRIVGIDDFAFRKGHRYGTIVVDLERRRVIDLLPDRHADTVAAWLAQHPTIEVVSRDRSRAYAEAATRGAPQALQVADRFHVVKNAREVLERYLARSVGRLDQAAEAAASPPVPPPPAAAAPAPKQPSADLTPQAAAARTRRQERIAAILTAHAGGQSLYGIARTLGLSRNTVRKYVRLGQVPDFTAEAAAHPAHRPRRSCLDAYKPYLAERWAAGSHNAEQLWREIVAQGFRGSKTTVRAWVAHWRTTPAPRGRWAHRLGPRGAPPPVPQRYSVAHTMWLLLGDPTTWTATEQAYLREVYRVLPEVLAVQALVQGFLAIVQNRAVAALDPWLRAAAASGYPELQSFAAGLRLDGAAVRAALEVHWSNGMVEGQVNRLKMVKRTMFGRAGFTLLRQRILDQGQLHQE